MEMAGPASAPSARLGSHLPQKPLGEVEQIYDRFIQQGARSAETQEVSAEEDFSTR
jgi:hypothetical protein